MTDANHQPMRPCSDCGHAPAEHYPGLGCMHEAPGNLPGTLCLCRDYWCCDLHRGVYRGQGGGFSVVAARQRSYAWPLYIWPDSFAQEIPAGGGLCLFVTHDDSQKFVAVATAPTPLPPETLADKMAYSLHKALHSPKPLSSTPDMDAIDQFNAEVDAGRERVAEWARTIAPLIAAAFDACATTDGRCDLTDGEVVE